MRNGGFSWIAVCPASSSIIKEGKMDNGEHQQRMIRQQKLLERDVLGSAKSHKTMQWVIKVPKLVKLTTYSFWENKAFSIFSSGLFFFKYFLLSDIHSCIDSVQTVVTKLPCIKKPWSKRTTTIMLNMFNGYYVWYMVCEPSSIICLCILLNFQRAMLCFNSCKLLANLIRATSKQ